LFKTPLLIFFLAGILLFQIVTFTPIALAQNPNEDINMPSWFKNIVKWWNEGKLTDKEIINVIENLLQREIIKLDSTKIKSWATLSESKFFLPPTKDGAKIPSDVKNTFVSWQEGSVSDSDVVDTIKSLIETNIIFAPKYSPDKPRPLAAIIDQLDNSIPNKLHQQRILKYFEIAGYDVDVYTTKDITIDFYKKLPSMNYEFIYIRTHSVEDVKSEKSTLLFTDEKYDINKYIPEQLSGQIWRGIPIYDQLIIDEMMKNDQALDETYFMIGSKFIDELATGKFPQSVIIIGGCESLRSHDLGQSFIDRGASSIIGWDSTINSIENDRVMLALMEEILINKKNLRDSIISAMDEFGQDLEHSSRLIYLHT
jgi:hypothetical protein